MIAITPAIIKSVFIELRIPFNNGLSIQEGVRWYSITEAPPMPTGTDQGITSLYRLRTPTELVQTDPEPVRGTYIAS